MKKITRKKKPGRLSTEAHIEVKPGDTAYISFDNNKLHLFDYQTTQNVLL